MSKHSQMLLKDVNSLQYPGEFTHYEGLDNFVYRFLRIEVPINDNETKNTDANNQSTNQSNTTEPTNVDSTDIQNSINIYKVNLRNSELKEYSPYNTSGKQTTFTEHDFDSNLIEYLKSIAEYSEILNSSFKERSDAAKEEFFIQIADQQKKLSINLININKIDSTIKQVEESILQLDTKINNFEEGINDKKIAMQEAEKEYNEFLRHRATTYNKFLIEPTVPMNLKDNFKYLAEKSFNYIIDDLQKSATSVSIYKQISENGKTLSISKTKVVFHPYIQKFKILSMSTYKDVTQKVALNIAFEVEYNVDNNDAELQSNNQINTPTLNDSKTAANTEEPNTENPSNNQQTDEENNQTAGRENTQAVVAIDESSDVSVNVDNNEITIKGKTYKALIGDKYHSYFDYQRVKESQWKLPQIGELETIVSILRKEKQKNNDCLRRLFNFNGNQTEIYIISNSVVSDDNSGESVLEAYSLSLENYNFSKTTVDFGSNIYILVEK